MALAPEPIIPNDQAAQADAPQLRKFVMALFFIFGGITSLNDVIIPKLKELRILGTHQIEQSVVDFIKTCVPRLTIIFDAREYKNLQKLPPLSPVVAASQSMLST